MQPKRILVVDDDLDILEALQFMLETEGFNVITSQKGEYAEHLHHHDGHLPDLIILDVLLSGKDGRLICQQLKSQIETKHIPVIMISAHPNAKASVKEVGADAFMAKPFSVDDLLGLINQYLAAST